MTTKSLGSSETLLSIIQNAEIACSKSNYLEAESLYSRAICIDKLNAGLYGNRSMTRFYLQNYDGALSDAELAIKLDPKYAKVKLIKLKYSFNLLDGCCLLFIEFS